MHPTDSYSSYFVICTKFLCDLCHDEIQGSEVNLKLHQIGLHLNPYYLSASDRILAQISSYAVQTGKTETPWVPDWDTFKVISELLFLKSFHSQYHFVRNSSHMITCNQRFLKKNYVPYFITFF